MPDLLVLLAGKCTSHRSKPAAELNLYVNDELVRPNRRDCHLIYMFDINLNIPDKLLRHGLHNNHRTRRTGRVSAGLQFHRPAQPREERQSESQMHCNCW